MIYVGLGKPYFTTITAFTSFAFIFPIGVGSHSEARLLREQQQQQQASRRKTFLISFFELFSFWWANISRFSTQKCVPYSNARIHFHPITRLDIIECSHVRPSTSAARLFVVELTIARWNRNSGKGRWRGRRRGRRRKRHTIPNELTLNRSKKKKQKHCLRWVFFFRFQKDSNEPVWLTDWLWTVRSLISIEFGALN